MAKTRATAGSESEGASSAARGACAVECPEGTFYSGQWEAHGTFTVPSLTISGSWQGSGWWEGQLEIEDGSFTILLSPGQWGGSGSLQINGGPANVPWSGSGDAWIGGGSVGPPPGCELAGSGVFGGIINGYFAYGTWEGTLYFDRDALMQKKRCFGV